MTGLTARNKTTALITVAVVLLIVDRFLKQYALNYHDTKIIIQNILSFSLSKNTGIAFSIASEKNITWLILLIAIIIFFFALKKLQAKNYFQTSVLILILFGAASNIFDRFIYGAVIDYFSFLQLTVFNLADISIIVGAALYLLTNNNFRANLAKP